MCKVMLKQMLNAKIHRATVTQSDLNYEGSLTIDRDLMDAVGIFSFERIKIYNINNGERFDTYAIEGPRGSGIIGLNGAAARKGMAGDLIIIVTYGIYSEEELQNYHPRIILLNERNQVKETLTK
jgi:aspartate 1-decarboxylase